MKKILICFLPAALLFSCLEKYDPDNFLFSDQKDDVIQQIVTFVAPPPKGTSLKNRSDSLHQAYYQGIMKDYSLHRFYVNSNGTRYFYLLRPARSIAGAQRGVGGSFKVKDNGDIYSFKEIFNTPVGSTDELITKGSELFQWMAKHGDVKPYEKNPDFIEWPSATSTYDTLRHEWVAR